MATKRTITLDQLKDALRFTFGDVYQMTDLTDYDNWVGFTRFIEDVWRNLDKRTDKKKKLELRRTPQQYRKWLRIPFIGDLYRRT